MVDYFALGITHFLLALAAWRLMAREDLDCDPADTVPPPASRKIVSKGADHA